MRICFLHRGYPPNNGNIGGIVPYITTMVKALKEAGHELFVFTEAANGAKPGMSEEDGVTVYRMKRPNTLPDILGTLQHFWMIARRLSEFAAQHRIDIVETCDYASESIFYTRKLRQSTKLLVKLHGPTAVLQSSLGRALRRRTLIASAMERRCILDADFVTAPTNLCRAQTADSLDLSPNIIHVAPNPIDTSFWTPQHQSQRSRLILFVGRLQTIKGVDRLGPPMNELLARFPDVTFRFIGSDHPDAYTGKSMMEGLLNDVPEHFQNRIDFIPKLEREQLVHQYRQATFCWFPSRWESFSLVNAEAMSCGIPVIVSKGTAISEIIEDGKSGFAVDFDNAQAVVECAERLLNSETLRNDMGIAARKRIETAYSLEASARIWIDLVTGTGGSNGIGAQGS